MSSKMPNAGKAGRVLGKRSDPGGGGHVTFLNKKEGASSQSGPMGKLPDRIKNSKTVHQK